MYNTGNNMTILVKKFTSLILEPPILTAEGRVRHSVKCLLKPFKDILRMNHQKSVYAEIGMPIPNSHVRMYGDVFFNIGARLN